MCSECSAAEQRGPPDVDEHDRPHVQPRQPHLQLSNIILSLLSKLGFSLVKWTYIFAPCRTQIPYRLQIKEILNPIMATNSTTPIVAWAPEPDGRGTIGLLWSCFATIFLCTWNAIHLSLPGESDSKTRIFFRRIGSMLWCLLVPEWFAFYALADVGIAIEMRKQTPGWSFTKCFFLQMGGFVVQSDGDDAQYQRVNPTKLFAMFKSGELPWPECSDDDIENRSKADWLVKAIGLVQILWFVTQIIGRWAQDLAVTTLEIFTLGIVICATVTYLASWEKPFDVQVPIIIHTKTSISPADCIDRVGQLQGEDVLRSPDWSWYASSVISVLFGAIHIAAWNSHFSSFAEQILWKVSSVGCTALALLLFVSFIDLFPKRLEHVASIVGCCMYITFRIYMFVEMFVSLRALPSSVYQTPKWSQYFPAFG